MKPLHNTILHVEPSADPVFVQNPQVLSAQAAQHPIIVRADQIGAVHLEDPLDVMPVDDLDLIPSMPVEVHITALQIPVVYQDVMSIVPGLHARPPVLPESPDGDIILPDPPENGYDFIFHVGVAGRGHLRLEQLAHKHGYRMKDAEGQYAPVVPVIKEAPKDPDAEMMDPQRNVVTDIDPSSAPVTDLGPPSDMSSSSIPVTEIGPPVPATEIGPPLPANDMGPPGVNRYQIHPRLGFSDPDTPLLDINGDAVDVVPPMIETHEQPAVRGYHAGYEQFSDELATEIDVASLIHNMKESGHTVRV